MNQFVFPYDGFDHQYENNQFLPAVTDEKELEVVNQTDDVDLTNIFEYFDNCDLQNTNNITFQGDLYLVKSYLKHETDSQPDNTNVLSNTSTNDEKICSSSNSTYTTTVTNNADVKLPGSYFVAPSLATGNDSSKASCYFDPFPGEPRMNYLLRFPKLVQIAMNSSNFKMMKRLYDEVLTEDCVFQSGIFGLTTGRQKLLEICRQTVEVMPDYYCIPINIQKFKRRIITHTLFTTGTMVFIDPNNLITKMFENLSKSEGLDEHTKRQVEIFQRCKSQNKMATYERKSRVVYGLNEKLTHVERFMMKPTSLEIYEFEGPVALPTVAMTGSGK
jgi:hypothetical protein